MIGAMQDRLDSALRAMIVHRAAVEHPFGTIKAWMGATHFKPGTLDEARTEISLYVLVYNLKWALAIPAGRQWLDLMVAGCH